MPNCRSEQTRFTALFLMILGFAVPALAQRTDVQKPFNLIENSAPSGSSIVTAPNIIDPVQKVDSSNTKVLEEQNLDLTNPSILKKDSLADTSAAYAQVSLGRKKISEVGLAAIGVGGSNVSDHGLDNMIWRGTSASDAVFLLNKTAVVSHSRAVTNLAYRVVARQSVPPIGVNLVATELVTARLAWLARAGRSNDLAVLATQLPESPEWANWKRWVVEHELMVRNDDAACGIVDKQVMATFDPFWHKANVICHAVKGNAGGARFAADILAANGVDDPIFFALTHEMLSGVPADNIDPNELETMHIILMDVVNRLIPLEGLAVLPSQMAQSVVRLKFLGSDARMVSTFDGLSRGLIDHNQVSKLWRNAGPVNGDPQLTLAQLDGEPTALTTAMAWRAIDEDASDKRLTRIVEAMQFEIKDGNGALMLPLYAELIRNAISDAYTSADMRFNEDGVAPKIAMLLAIDNPNDISTIEGLSDNGNALLAAQLMQIVDTSSSQTKVLSNLDTWSLFPVLQAVGAVVPAQEWLALVKDSPSLSHQFVNLEPLLINAVLQAAEKRRVAETILLANWLLQTAPLDIVNPKDLAQVITALRTIGQDEVAKSLAKEVLRAHLLSRFIKSSVNDTSN